MITWTKWRLQKHQTRTSYLVLWISNVSLLFGIFKCYFPNPYNALWQNYTFSPHKPSNNSWDSHVEYSLKTQNICKNKTSHDVNHCEGGLSGASNIAEVHFCHFSPMTQYQRSKAKRVGDGKQVRTICLKKKKWDLGPKAHCTEQ